MNKRQRKKRAYGLRGVLVIQRGSGMRPDGFERVLTNRCSLSDYSEDMPKDFLKDCVAISVSDFEFLLEKLDVLWGENQKQREAIDEHINKALGR
jgi:hypothetical protein